MKRVLSMLLVLILIFSLGSMAIPAAASERYLRGDLNSDMIVNVTDALRLFRYVNNQIDSLGAGIDGDITVDGKIDITDALKLFRYVNNQIDSLDITETPDSDGYSIVDIEITDDQVNVLLSTVESCLLNLRFINEDGTETVGDDIVQIVTSGLQDEIVSASLPSGLPGYYKVIAYLSDENGNHLCDSFTSIHETANYQDFMDKTVNDFAGDTVINFDNDPNDNFGVLADGVVYATGASITETTTGYVVTGADEALKNLQPGQVVYIADANDIAIAIKAQSVSVRGDTVTIVEGEDIDISDIYQYLQIDMDFDDNSNAVVTPAEGVTYQFDNDPSSIDFETDVFADAASEEPQTDGFSMVPVNIENTKTLHLNAPTVYLKGDKDSTHNISLKIGCEIAVGFKLHAAYDVVIFGKDYFEMSYTCTKSGSVSVKVSYNGSWDSTQDKDGKKEQRIKLADEDFPLGATGLTAGFEVYVPYSIEIEAGLETKYSWQQSETVSYSTTNGVSTSKSKDSTVNILQPQGSITLKIGVEIDVTVALLKDVVKISLYVKVTLSGTIQLATDLGTVTDAESKHTCAVCLTLNVDLILTAGVKLSVKVPLLIDDTIIDGTLLEVKIPLFTGYCSVSHGFKFGRGECPYKDYRVLVTLKDKNGNEVTGQDFTVTGGTSTSGTTGTKLYLAGNANYVIKLNYNGHTYTKTLNNLSAAQNVVFTEAASTGTLKGKVCKASDRSAPISGAEISVYSGNDLYMSVSSDSNGSYSTDLPVGEYRIVTSANGYLPFTSYATVTENQAAYMETFLMIDESDDETGCAAGYITSALTGSGIEGVSLTFRNGWNNEQGDIVATTTSGGSGYYSIDLPLGNYTMYMEKDGYVSSMCNVIVQAGTTGNQNGSLTPAISGDSYRIVLTWGSSPRDMDSHLEGTLSSESHFHVYYAHKDCYDGNIEVCNLDVDDTSSYGPETITLNVTTDDPYYYYVYKYSSDGTTASSASQVKVYQGSTLVATFNVPTDQGSGDYWNVFAIVNGELVVQNTVTSSKDLTYAGVGVDGTAYDYEDEEAPAKEDLTVTEEDTADDNEPQNVEAENDILDAAAPEATEPVTEPVEEAVNDTVIEIPDVTDAPAEVPPEGESAEMELQVSDASEIGR